MDIKNKIINYSRKLKVDLVGFTDAKPLEELRGLIIERKSNNYLSGFEERDIEKRLNPHITLQEAKSIIVIGMSYAIDEKQLRNKENNEGFGIITRSAWGKDYHQVLMERMESLTKYIKEEVPGFIYRIFVDTGPLVDRHLAYKSGIGFYGKNNCIISKEYGSWIFIGYILCNLDIEPDETTNISCINCNKCIINCPTNALMENGLYNAKRCISYLTQTKEDIPYDLREKMGYSIYGCDICQVTCPHNADVKISNNQEFMAKDYFLDIRPIDILDLTNKDFKEKFKGTAAGWRGKNVIKRNAIIALGNSQKGEYINCLKKYLYHDSIMLVKYSAWAIIRIDKVLGKEILDKYLDSKKSNDNVIKEIERLYEYYL